MFTTIDQIDQEISRLQILKASMMPKLPFATVFDASFRILDRKTGSHNFVKLEEIRPMLVGWDKVAFDGELRKLRIAGRYTLSGIEGRHGVTEAQRAAAIMEDGEMLGYVSVR